ncbi:DNA polymerase epsilon catalytic subunit A [Terfezia boudieri ATCC MYA-4762]|uniref:DNA polymerase epsilon catalytic subunit n=1 Tax=Terfezia boudieri ATCC MYA-4762 TaxID=1051890 RepID=A0A3N4LWA8_9PEZI|nr:DNA polymerase epsilon catalytic subunit A [Terfezia boudieri ATCC MYA-4762]
MSSRRGNNFHKRGSFRGGPGDSGRGRGGYRGRLKTVTAGNLLPTDGISNSEKFESARLSNQIDEAYGFPRYESGPKKVGWLVNMHTTILEDGSCAGGKAAVDYYFLDDFGGSFKASLVYDPYFMIACKLGAEGEVEEWLRRKFEGQLKKTTRWLKEDLSMPNHLLGYRRTYIQLSFNNISDLLAVRKVLLPIAEANKKKQNAMDAYMEVASATTAHDFFDDSNDSRKTTTVLEASDCIIDIREFDVPYHVRVAIDKDIRVGRWYTVEAKHGVISITCIVDRLKRAEPVVLAYDIETTKLPLKFPDAVIDQVMMISYMIEGQGFLITNREIVSQDIEDFEYTPKPEYEGFFVVFNEPDERAVLERFFEHIKEAKPTVIVTYNGDFFDWPFVEARASFLGIDMYQEIGFRRNSEDIYQSTYCAHMDAFAWVNRDSYLPQGSRGLKAVTTAKLGYDPDELDPELMTRYAREKPQTLAEYSVSDAVATYYLYMKYVHPFIFSLCTIIPLNPDDVLRKGTGTLCEMLLMVQAYQKEIILPNKHKGAEEAFYEGHLLESETYVGGHVESIEAGVFRADIPTNFVIDTSAIDELLGDLDAALKFSIVVESKKKIEDVTNYEEVKEQIKAKLLKLKETPQRLEGPLIYHLDVASMYPNIMTTNRLQPDSMIKESDCAACDFNRPGKRCDRRLPWAWRGEYLPAKRNEYNMIKRSLENEKFPAKHPNQPPRHFEDLSSTEQASLIKKRLQDYSKKIYHKIHESKTIEKEAIICQRENPFYVDTVKDFRDRRYDFKGQQKVWKRKEDDLKASGATVAEVDEAKKMTILFDSLQLAHKVILNSFYGYVMRKGSRWYSMEMAGVTCLTGAHIIQMAKELVERVGRPLELDTDGIWCILPATFPENFAFTLQGGRKLPISYPCVMLNHLVHAKFTNDQYQELIDPITHRYETHSENTIFFEVDGPYKAMILPTSKEEDKNLKKRYAVFNHDGSLAELKGFEIKRRGELKLIKIFQGQIFKFFLEGKTLQECYGAVAKISNQWLDVLYSHGNTLSNEELIDLISENRSMTKTLEEYGAQKSTSITTARRLAEFLGEQMVKDKGLNCRYVISSRPKGAPVTERAIPVAIFSADSSIKAHFLRKWLKDDPGEIVDPRTIIDWDYYLERLGSVIQKLITIPAALQKVRNPVPRVVHPDWLQRRINIKDDKFKQKKMTDLFKKSNGLQHDMRNKPIMDLEDFGTKPAGSITLAGSKRKTMEPPPKSVSDDPFASLPVIMPSMTKDYKGWLKYQKQKWKLQKHARARRRQLFGEKRDTHGDAIGIFFRNQAEMLFSTTWQILGLQETNTAGEVRAWVLIDKKIYNLRIKVPREIYMNLKGKELPDVDVKGCSVEKVTHTLPNGHPSVHLFKLTMPEHVYISEEKKFSALLCHQSVEGVYETQVPLSVRALLNLGHSCTYDESQKGVLGKGLEQGFDLSTLRKIPLTTPYLAGPSMEYLFLYHIVSGERQIVALFSTLDSEAYVQILGNSKDAANLPGVDKVYLEQLARRLKASNGQPWQNSIKYQEALKFKVEHATTKKKLYKALADLIKQLKPTESKAMMLVVQSPQRRALIQAVPRLNEFPIIPLRSDASDSNLPPLGWQSFIAKRVVTHYLALGSWVSHLLELARYGNVPICNLERDDPRYLIDIAYARRLQRNSIVLWWSSSPNPDHGGHEKDDILGSFESVEMPAINNSGSFSSICVDIEVRNLVINTILTSSLINELEGSDSISLNPAAPGSDETGDGNGMNVIFSDTAFATAGVTVLREMVRVWWTEACAGNNMADIMVQHLVRWVESKDSFLYDRALHYYVQMMSKKAFQQLMTDFRRVGSNVVYASANRLILQTSKVDVGNAYAYAKYIVKAIKAKPLFSFLDLEVKEYWDYLLWFDEVNYGGKATTEVEMEAEAAAGGQGRKELGTVMHWQMGRFLPPVCRSVFDEWVIEFVEIMHGIKHGNATNTDGGVPRLTQLPARKIGDDAADGKDKKTPIVLTKEFTKPLRKQVAQLLRRQNDAMLNPQLSAFAEEFEFPPLPGTVKQLTNPSLQLVKSLIAVFSLAKEISLEVRMLRKELLAIFDVREFSKQGMFENPCGSVKFPQLVCSGCTLSRDLDLCKDEDIIPSAKGEVGAVGVEWKCQHCGTRFDKLKLEEELVGRVYKAVTKYNTQDLRCVKCKTLRTNEFLEHCGCSGAWEVAGVGREEVVDEVRLLGGVAGYYGLGMLEAVVKGVLKGI